MTALTEDLRHALRQLRRRPGFAATAVLTLAVGMGVNTIAFSVVNGLLIKGFTASAVPGVGRIATTPARDENGYASRPEFERFAEATAGALDLAAEGRLALAWRHGGASDTAWALAVTPNYFSLVRVEPVAGQLRVGVAAGAAPSVVVSERFWREALGTPPLAGLTVRLNGVDAAVAGVVPRSFAGPGGLYAPDVWVPLDAIGAFSTSPALLERETRWLFVLGRVEPGETPASVQGRVDAAAAAMARDWPGTHRGRGARFRMLGEKDGELGGLVAAAWIGMAVIGLVLLLACFNVATLLLARGVERERDLGIRAALGAGRARLLRLVLAEGLVLAALSGALALLLAWWTQSLVGAFAMPIDLPQQLDVTPDRTVIAFVAALVVVAGVLPAAWPAVAASRLDVRGVLGSQAGGGRRRSPLGAWLVRAEVAGATAFLVVAALLVQSYASLAATDPGFETRHLLVAEFDAGAHGFAAARAGRHAADLLDRVRGLPGVTAAALADRAPFFIGYDRLTPVWPATGPCDPASCPEYRTFAVGPGYFRTLGIPVVAGREFAAGPDAGEAIVDESFAREHWPTGHALGQALRLGREGTAATVVGVVADARTRGLGTPTPTLFLRIGARDYAGPLTLVARTAPPPGSLTRAVADAAAAASPDVPLRGIRTMEERMSVPLWPSRTLGWLLSICALLAAALAAVGLAGVVAHATARRTREFGVRLSIGASPADLARDVLRGSVALAGPGLVAGLVLAAAAARLARAAIVGVETLDPLTYAAVVAAEAAVIVAAGLLPARRAARVDPVEALRAE
ncbi:MAG: ADOP family duplicated permease [Vicinamibacterales bacterium]